MKIIRTRLTSENKPIIETIILWSPDSGLFRISLWENRSVLLSKIRFNLPSMFTASRLYQYTLNSYLDSRST